MRRATSVEPVNGHRDARDRRFSAAPASPVTRHQMQRGLRHTGTMQQTDRLGGISGVCSAGLATTLFPAASAAPPAEENSRAGNSTG